MPDLFAHFEVNREPRWKIVMGLLAGSAFLHLALAASVVFVPTFRDALNIAALAGKTGYVDRAYKKTIVGDEVRLVQVSARFEYPAGYFAPPGALLPGASGTAGVPDPFAPKIVSQASAVKPGSAASPSPSPLPVGSPSPGAAPSPSGSPLFADAKQAAKDSSEIDKQLDQIARDNNVLRPDADEINKRPLTDWLKKANDKKEKHELDLTKVVELKIEAQLTKDCTLAEVAVAQKSGDERLIELAKDLAAAIGDSRMLSFLRDPGKKGEGPLPCEAGPLSLGIMLDAGEISAEVEKQAESPERAAQLATAYNFMLFLGQQKKEGKDEEAIYKHTKVVTDGKQILVRFRMPRQTAGEMLTKQLKPAS